MMQMNSSGIDRIEEAFEAAVVAFLNAVPGSQVDDAEEFVDAMAQLVFITIDTYFKEHQNDSTRH